MKTYQKILIVLLAAICLVAIMPKNVSMAAGGSRAVEVINSVSADEDSNADYSGLTTVISRLLGFLQVASGLVAVIMIAITGFRYIISQADVKSEMLKNMLPIVVGLIVVFAASGIARLVISAVAR